MSLAFPKARVFGQAAASVGGGDPRVGERLVVSGPIFRYPDGTPHRVLRSSDFRFGQRLTLFGDDMEAIAAERKACGANSLRIFCQYATGIGNDGRILKPSDYTPDRILATARWLRDRFLRVEFTILADCEQLGMDHEAQKRRVLDVFNALQGEPNVMLELCNEPAQNGCDVDRLARELGYAGPNRFSLLMATGKYDYTNDGVVLDVFNNHLERKQAWPGEAGKEGNNLYYGWPASDFGPAFKGAHVPIVSDEPIGATNDPNPNYGRRDNRPDAFEDGGAGEGSGSAGACFHSDSGVQSVLYGEPTASCARAFFRGLSYFPADCATFRYTHDGLADHPLSSTAGRTTDEVVARINGTTAYVVAASPAPGYVPVPVNGWRIAVEHSTRRNILTLTR